MEKPHLPLMTDRQFQILDELYFMTSFRELASQTGLPANELVSELETMNKFGWVKILYPTPDQESTQPLNEWKLLAEECFYLATKTGLFAHNGR
jgi:hypothetical protein